MAKIYIWEGDVSMFCKLNTVKAYIVALYDKYEDILKDSRSESEKEKIRKNKIKVYSLCTIYIILFLFLIIWFYLKKNYTGIIFQFIIYYIILKFIINKNNSNLDQYNSKIKCLIRVLKENNMYNEEIIEKLIKNSKAVKGNVLMSILALLSVFKVYTIIKGLVIKNNNIKDICISLLFLAVVLGIIIIDARI